ncbi:MAG: hypothetical protein JXQ96_18260 [Cyclobacteriaceae bacterium]
MTNTNKITIKTLALIIVAGVLFSCSGNKKAEQASNETEEKKETINKIAQTEFKYPIPTSYQVTELLQGAGAAFVLAITNDPGNVEKYETQKSKALNLGVYGADLSYASTYNRQDETLKLLEASKTLIDGLEIPNVFTQSMADRIETNIEEKDSLINIITQSFYDTHAQLNQAGESKLALLVVAGSWIESLYITSNLAISSNYDKQIMDIVGNQKIAAKKLAELCENYKDDSDVKSILPLIRFMNLIYDGVIEGAGITEGQLGDILENVESTRSEIVG